MKKIPSVFMRSYDGDRLVRDEVVPGCEWVLADKGIPTIKWDGSAVLVRSGALFKRYDAKPGRKPPPGWEPCEPDPDPNTGHNPGWVPCSATDPADRWYLEALANTEAVADGTYEAVGPHFQANPHGFGVDHLERHGAEVLQLRDITFGGIRNVLALHPQIEGIVWYHPDGFMAKIKRRDFGLPWPVKA